MQNFIKIFLPVLELSIFFTNRPASKSSQTGRRQNLHKLSGNKIKCLIIGHSIKFNFKFQLTFLGSCNFQFVMPTYLFSCAYIPRWKFRLRNILIEDKHGQKPMQFLTVNTCGLKSKLIIPVFCDVISQYDITGLQETKSDTLDSFEIPGYTLDFKHRKDVSKRKPPSR